VPAVKKALIRIVENKAFLIPSLSRTSFSLDDEDDLLHLSAFQPGDLVLHYRILEEIAEGGMGQIYRAEDEILRRRVALKVLPQKVTKNEKAKKRMLREARLAASLNHPNICSIYEIGEKDGHTFISMEYVDGITLQKRLESGPMEIDEVLRIGIQIADALKEAHKRQIIHRDIKSLNIILTDRKHVKVLDFGLAKKLSDVGIHETRTPLSTQLTESGEVMGTLHFMSPEQALGKSVDYRSDIFSFGIVLYQMLTGKIPFTGNSIPHVIDSILNSNPVPIARFNDNTPDRLVRLVQWMMDKDPEKRCQTMEQVWIDLCNIQEEISGKKQMPSQSKSTMKLSTDLKEIWERNRTKKHNNPG
jgi:Serine/threonine protein kinase